MNKLTQAVGLALAVTSGSAMALTLDFDGVGGPADFAAGELAMLTSSAILSTVLDPTGGSLVNPGTFYIQARYELGGGSNNTRSLTYQLSVPVISTVSPLAVGISTVGVTLSGPGTFKIFFDNTATNDATPPPPAGDPYTGEVRDGLGFGDVNGGALNAGQVEIASGSVTLSSVFALLINDLGGADPMDAGPPAGTNNPLFAGVTSTDVSGSVNFDVDVLTQNNLYVLSDLVNAGLSLDMTLQNIAFTSPFTPPNIASTEVVNYSAYLGSDDIQDTNCTSGAGGTKIDGTAVAAGTFCDLEMQIGGNSKFFDSTVPEPGTLALAGLGLSALGLGRRRRKAA